MPAQPPGGEFDLIARFFAPLTGGRAQAFGLKDDAALLQPTPGYALVVTKDLIVEGVHYLPDETPERIAQRLLRVNLSDLAAMGAEARAYALGIALPRDTSAEWLEGFSSGLRADQATFGVELLGGDTVSTDGPAVLSLTALGEIVAGNALTRSGARAGDDIFVSGTIGDGALGLRAARGGLATLSVEERTALESRYRLPLPRLALGSALAGLAHSAIDISDGLVADLGHICAASEVGAEIRAADVPLSPAAAHAVASGAADIAAVLAGGDDYELLFTAAREARDQVAALADSLALPLTRVGTIEAGRDVTVLGSDGAQIILSATGYAHF